MKDGVKRLGDAEERNISGSWWRRPLRVVQTILREIDIRGYDAEAMVDYAERVHANAIVVNAGGIVAFYKSKVGLHHPNAFMTDEDVLREIVPLAHARGLKVLGRVDFRGAKRWVYDRKPDWFARTADGEPRMTAGIYAACPNSPYRNEHAFAVIREVLTDCNLDGIWENAAAFGPTCHCQWCRAAFREACGEKIPRRKDWDDPVYRTYLRWRYDVKGEQSMRWREVIKSCGPDKGYCAEFPGPNVPGWVLHGALDINLAGEAFDFLLCPCFVIGRGSYGSPFLQTPIWGSLELMKYLRNCHPEKTPVICFSHLEQTSRYTSEPPRDLEVWMQGVLATGGSFWDCTFVGMNPARAMDRRNIDLVARYYGCHEEWTDLLQDAREIADIAIVYSRVTQDRFGRNNPDDDAYVTHIRGWEQLLLERHAPFTLIPETRLETGMLERFRVIILANTACLSDRAAAAIRKYVRAGGAVIGTYQTSLFDADWELREDFALGDVFGVRYRGMTLGPLPLSYQWLRRDHPIAAGFGDTDMLVNNGSVCLTECLPGAGMALTLVPEIVPQHPENAWIPEMETDIPTVVTHRFGSGRAVYFANQADRYYLADGHSDYGALLDGALKWASGTGETESATPAWTAEAPPSVWINGLRTTGGQLVFTFINVTGNPKRALSEAVPVDGIRVSLGPRLMDGLSSSGTVRLLCGGETVRLESTDAGPVLALPRLGAFAVAVLE